MLVGLLPRGHSGKESACQCRRLKRCGFNPCVGKIPWRRKWQPTLVFLPGKFHRQRRLAGCGAWAHKESDTTEWLNTHTHTHTHAHAHHESESEVTQLCLTLCNPMDCSLLDSSIHGILQARILEYRVAISFSRGSSRHRDRTQVSRIAGRLFTAWAHAHNML